MDVHRISEDSQRGPAECFTGHVQMDPISAPAGAYRVGSVNVHFSPGARCAWHYHPAGQTVFVTDGILLIQRRGEAIQEVHPGDTVFIAPGEEHWHGATPTRSMTHVAMVHVPEDGVHTVWLDHVTDDEYKATRATATIA